MLSAAAVTAESSLPVYNTTTGAISAVAAGSESAGEGYAFIPGATFKYVDASAGDACVIELNDAPAAPATTSGTSETTTQQGA